jgi:hypothetical protein
MTVDVFFRIRFASNTLKRIRTKLREKCSVYCSTLRESDWETKDTFSAVNEQFEKALLNKKSTKLGLVTTVQALEGHFVILIRRTGTHSTSLNPPTTSGQVVT